MKKKANAIAGLLFFFMALVCVGVFMPAVLEVIDNNVDNISTFSTNGAIIGLIIRFFPAVLVIMMLIILVIILK